MKSLITLALLVFYSTASFAAFTDLDFLNYRDFNLKTTETGTYTWVSNCTHNDLFWEKSTQSYKKRIEDFSEKGIDTVEVKGNEIKTNSQSFSSDNTRYFYETTTTFNSENSFVRTNKTRTIFDDKTEINKEYISEGTYENGKVQISRYLIDGEESPLSKATSIIVWLDKEGMEIYEVTAFESSRVKAEMEDSRYTTVFLKTERVCKTKSTKF